MTKTDKTVMYLSLVALEKYAHVVADGAEKRTAIEAAQKAYQTAQIPF